MTLRFLVAEGSTRSVRKRHKAAIGETMSERYAAVLCRIVPGATYDICFPADRDAELPEGTALGDYDAVFITGSHLQLSKPDDEGRRQVELARAVLNSGTPLFGSCWGLQVTVVALGGEVAEDPAGGELAIARAIIPTEAGRGHPLLAGRPTVFDALSVHFDSITQVPQGASVLAANERSVQALELPGRFWGVQYHPELTPLHVATALEREPSVLVEKGFFRKKRHARAFFSDLEALEAEPERSDLRWKYGMTDEALDQDRRETELRNLVERLVAPAKRARGRG